MCFTRKWKLTTKWFCQRNISQRWPPLGTNLMVVNRQSSTNVSSSWGRWTDRLVNYLRFAFWPKTMSGMDDAALSLHRLALIFSSKLPIALTFSSSTGQWRAVVKSNYRIDLRWLSFGGRESCLNFALICERAFFFHHLLGCDWWLLGWFWCLVSGSLIDRPSHFAKQIPTAAPIRIRWIWDKTRGTHCKCRVARLKETLREKLSALIHIF